MAELTIGEVARRAGLQTSAVRYYESIGLLPPPRRESGQRRYDPGILDRLTMIRAAREIGFTLEEIRTLLDGFPTATPPSERWRTLADDRLPAIDALIERALLMKHLLESGLRCDCESIEACFITFQAQHPSR